MAQDPVPSHQENGPERSANAVRGRPSHRPPTSALASCAMPPRLRALAPALAVIALVACARASTVAPTGATSADITETDLRHRLFLIADDSMLGRLTGSEGAHKTTEYIASEFRRLGLEPAGENGTYFQTMPA